MPRRLLVSLVICAANQHAHAAALRPPSMPLYSKRLGVIRESIAYLKDPDSFVAERTSALGPVFLAGMFFRPTVFVGGPEAVDEFIQKESVITESSLPPTFEALHTEYGALNQEGETHQASRQAFVPLFATARMREYIPLLEERTTAFVDALAERGETALAAECKRFYLDVFAELFTGAPLSDEDAERFVEYNGGLLSLGKWTPQYRRGERALHALRQVFLDRLARARGEGLDKPRYAVLRYLTECTEADGTVWSDERIATAIVLFVWGGYVEVAALVAKAVVALGTRPDLAKAVRAEVGAAGLLRRGGVNGDAMPTGAAERWWALPLTNGVLRESLRLNAPAGGGFRVTTQPLSIAGFDIEAGTVVTADPRISNMMERLHASPELFEPRRWVAPTDSADAAAGSGDSSATSRCPFAGLSRGLRPNAWHPGGIGVHGCPGVPLAELLGRMFLARWVEAIDTWQQADGGQEEPAYELIPIKIPIDSYTVSVTRRQV